jgi:O-antigen/teichoic acid export membrane protein
MIWAVLQQVGGQAVNLINFLLLAAILRPGEFGVLGMAMAWLAILAAFAESGFGAAVVQRAELEPEHLTTTFGITLAIGILLGLLGAALSWPAALVFRTPELQPVMAALSLGFPIRAVSLTHAALAQRELRFRALAGRDIASSVVGGIVSVILALRGYGVWSLVALSLVSAIMDTVLLWRITTWRPRLGEWSLRHAHELWPYSSRMLGFSLFKAAAQNADRFVIGLRLGPADVGLYVFAWRVVVYPVNTVVGAIGQWLFSVLARAQADAAQVRRQYLYATAAVTALVTPGLVALALLAPTLVPLLGEKWRPAITVVQVLTVVALAQAVFSPAGQVMKGLDRPGWLLGWSIGVTAFTSLGLLVGAGWGVVGAAVGFALAHLIGIPVVIHLTRRLVTLRPTDFSRYWGPSAAASLCLGLLIWLARQTRLATTALGAVAALVLGLAGYGLALGWFSPALVRAVRYRLRQALQSQLRRAASAGTGVRPR